MCEVEVSCAGRMGVFVRVGGRDGVSTTSLCTDRERVVGGAPSGLEHGSRRNRELVDGDDRVWCVCSTRWWAGGEIRLGDVDGCCDDGADRAGCSECPVHLKTERRSRSAEVRWRDLRDLAARWSAFGCRWRVAASGLGGRVATDRGLRLRQPASRCFGPRALRGVSVDVGLFVVVLETGGVGSACAWVGAVCGGCFGARPELALRVRLTCARLVCMDNDPGVVSGVGR